MTIKESQSVITWDFDVMKGDVQFTVFRHKRPREAISSTSLSSIGSNASVNQSGVVAGVDAVVVEKPRHCCDGESIQVCDENEGKNHCYITVIFTIAVSSKCSASCCFQ